MALYYTFLAFLDSRACWFFLGLQKAFFLWKNKGSIAGSIILRLNWDEKYFDLRFLEKNEKNRFFLKISEMYILFCTCIRKGFG